MVHAWRGCVWAEGECKGKALAEIDDPVLFAYLGAAGTTTRGQGHHQAPDAALGKHGFCAVGVGGVGGAFVSWEKRIDTCLASSAA